MPYSYKKLRGRIVEMYGTMTEFAKELGISRVNLSGKMNGKVGFSQEDIDKWCDLLEIETDEIGDYFFS